MVTCPSVPPGERIARAHPRVPTRPLRPGSCEAYFPEPEVAIARLNTCGTVLQNDWFHADVHCARRRAPGRSGAVPRLHVLAGNLALSADASPSLTLGSSGASAGDRRGCSTSCAPSRSATWRRRGGADEDGFTKDMRMLKPMLGTTAGGLEAVEDVDLNQLANGVVDDSSLNWLKGVAGRRRQRHPLLREFAPSSSRCSTSTASQRSSRSNSTCRPTS